MRRPPPAMVVAFSSPLVAGGGAAFAPIPHLRRRVAGFLALLAALSAVLLPGSASAATITVTTKLDGLDVADICTLRDAVRSANGDTPKGGCPPGSGADTIVLGRGEYQLSLPGTDDAAANGDLDVTESLTIKGIGPDRTGINGNGALTGDRVLDVFFLAALSLDSLRVHDGVTTGGGGGIRAASAATPSLTNTAVNGNQAGSLGGGIFSLTSANLTNSTVTGNQAGSDGGGIATGEMATLTNSTVGGNESAGSGGGVATTGIATLTNSTVTGNRSAGVFGGGIEANIANLTHSTVSGNTATGNGRGGGIGATIANLTDSTVSGNKAIGSVGGPVDGVGGGLDVFSATFTNSTVSGNQAGFEGGGLMATTASFTNSTVSGNQAGSFGGAITTAGGDLTLTASTVAANSADESGGGVAFVGNGTFNARNSTLSGNEANTSGGGIFQSGLGTINLANATINRNTADANGDGTGDGGGIFITTPPVNAKNTILAGNHTVAGSGPDCFGPLTSQGYNLFQSTAGCTISGDTTGNVTAPPKLASLADNGGPTLTQALLPGSPAIDAGSPLVAGSGGNACEATDQRGVPRTLGGRCDIGAYERVNPRPPVGND